MIWFVALGGAVGSVARLLLNTFVQQRVGASFPTGTLAINVIGSLLVGFLLRYTLASPSVSTEMRAMLTTGFCGAFTTFSAFSYETMVLIEDGEWGRASVYVLLSVGLSLAAVLFGIMSARELLAWRHRA